MSQDDVDRSGLRGKRWVLRILATLGLLTVAACANTDSISSTSDSTMHGKQSGEMSEALKELRNNPRVRDAIAVLCKEALLKEDNRGAKPFLASFLRVAPAQAEIAFCNALFEAITAEELSDKDLRQIRKAGDNRDYVLVGQVMRKLLIAHERLTTQQVSRPSLFASHPDAPNGRPATDQ